MTNYTKTETRLDNWLSKGVHCWDGRRLNFYSVKARTALELAFKGPLIERDIEGFSKASYLIQTQTGTGAMLANVVIFVDDHDRDFTIGPDHVRQVLKYIYKTSLKPMVDANRIDVQVAFKFHMLGIADKSVVETAYFEYAMKNEEHPKVVFSGPPVMFQYGAAPWAPLLTSLSWI